MAAIALATVPVTVGDADNAGVELSTGAAFGLMRMVTDAALPWPIRFDALSTTAKSPLCVGVPEISPVLGSAVTPAGRPVAR